MKIQLRAPQCRSFQLYIWSLRTLQVSVWLVWALWVAGGPGRVAML